LYCTQCQWENPAESEAQRRKEAIFAGMVKNIERRTKTKKNIDWWQSSPLASCQMHLIFNIHTLQTCVQICIFRWTFAGW